MIPQIISVEHLGGHRLRVRFSDGFCGDWDHTDILKATGLVARPLHDPAYFAQVAVVDGALTWSNGYDVCPVTLRRALTETSVNAY